jgi:hypothetical protein
VSVPKLRYVLEVQDFSDELIAAMRSRVVAGLYCKFQGLLL